MFYFWGFSLLLFYNFRCLFGFFHFRFRLFYLRGFYLFIFFDFRCLCFYFRFRLFDFWGVYFFLLDNFWCLLGFLRFDFWLFGLKIDGIFLDRNADLLITVFFLLLVVMRRKMVGFVFFLDFWNIICYFFNKYSTFA